MLVPGSPSSESSSCEPEPLSSSTIDCFLTTCFPAVWERLEPCPKFLCYNAWKMHLKEAFNQKATLQKWFFHHVPINLRMLLSTFSFMGMKLRNISSYSKFFISTCGNWLSPRYQIESKPGCFFVFCKRPQPHCYVSELAALFLSIKQGFCEAHQHF